MRLRRSSRLSFVRWLFCLGLLLSTFPTTVLARSNTAPSSPPGNTVPSAKDNLPLIRSKQLSNNYSRDDLHRDAQSVSVASVASTTPTPTWTWPATWTPTPTGTGSPYSTGTPTPTWTSVTGTVSPTTTPASPTFQNLRVTGITDNGAIISWDTGDQALNGFVEYGTAAGSYPFIASDPRDQFDALGSHQSFYVGETHVAPLTNLNPTTTYYYQIVSGSVVDDNQGRGYQFTTAPTLGTLPPFPDVITGTVVFGSNGGSPAAGALVYATIVNTGSGTGSPDRSSQLVAVADGNGLFVLTLNARTTDLSQYYSFTPDQGYQLQIAVDDGMLGEASLVFPASIIGSNGIGTTGPIVLSPVASQVINLSSGWSFIGLTVQPQTANPGALTAEDMIAEASHDGLDVNEIASWSFGTWQIHLASFPGTNNFAITPGTGYFLLSSQRGSFTLEGIPLSSPVPVSFSSGWTAVSLPVTSTGNAYTTETLAGTIQSQNPNVAIETVVEWTLGTWAVHTYAPDAGNVWTLRPGDGYFIRTTVRGTFTP